MPITRGLKPVLFALCLLSFSGVMLARQQAGRDQPLTQEQLAARLPADPEVKTGAFPNGLRYYVRRNGVPMNRAELRLVVNAGSLLEEDDQQGLAHFVEHMAFNGTRNFPKSDIVKFMEAIGMRFGPSVNAFTSFDETVYKLQIPTDKADVIDRALLILEDWAHNVTFDPVEVDKERGVIMEEWRLRRGAQARMQDQQFPVLLKGSRYAERLPIGKTEILQTFKPERLKQFYADWYRPDLMAVVAVGDFDVAAMEGLIKKRFAGIPAKANPKPRPVFDVPKQPGTLYSVVTDPEASASSVSAYSKMAFRDQSTVGAYRRMIVERLFSSMLSARLAELVQKPDAPFLAAGTSRGVFVKSAEASMLGAMAKDDAIEKALQALLAETERVAKFGFTATELDREKASYQRAVDQAVTEAQKRQSADLADEYVRNFTQAEPFPGLANEADITRRALPGITLAELNSLAKEWMPEGNRVILVTAPKKAGVVVPDEQRLAAAVAAASTGALTAYADTTTGKALLAAPPRPGSVANASVRADVGIVEWTLSNGVKVVLKPTTFKDDEVVFRAFSPGGSSLAEDADVLIGQTAASIVESGGVGDFSRIELRKILSDKVAGASPYISELAEGFEGSASVKDLETMFQLIYLSFMQPRPDAEALAVGKAQLKSMLTNMRSQPMFAFEEALNEALTQNHPRQRTPTPEMIDKLDLNRAMAFYKDRFSDASDFTFVFVGTLDPAVMRPLVETYLGSLPSTGRKETWKDRHVVPPSTVVERRVEKGLEPQSHARVVFTGPFVYSQEQRIAIRAMASILEVRLREILREELGGTYSVSVSAEYDKFPRSEFSVSVDFGCSPDRTEELLKRVFAEVGSFKASGPSAKQLADAREGFIREHETNLTSNNYLLGQIAARYENGEADQVGVLFNMGGWYQRLTAESVREAARQYLDTGRYVKVTLFPEKR